MISEGRVVTILTLLQKADSYLSRAAESDGEPACMTYMRLAKRSCEAAILHARLLDVPLSPPEATAIDNIGDTSGKA